MVQDAYNNMQHDRFGLPVMPENVPVRGQRFLKWLGAVLYRLAGWRVDGQIPNLSKLVLIGAPHTSNWDFVMAILAVFALDLQVSILGKHNLFVWPFRGFLRWLGVVPTNRQTSAGVVATVVAEFEQRKKFVLGLAPEGTRNKVPAWKTGFYHIAEGANVPIVPIGLDFGRKSIRIGALVMPSGDMAADLAIIQEFYKDVVGKNPELA